MLEHNGSGCLGRLRTHVGTDRNGRSLLIGCFRPTPLIPPSASASVCLSACASDLAVRMWR